MKVVFPRVQPWLALLALPGILFLWSQVYTHYSVLPLELLLPGLVLLVLLGRFVTGVAWVWWGLGIVTVFWSLAPSRALMGGLWESLYLVAFAAGAAVFSAPRAASLDWKSYLTSPRAWFWAAQWWLLLDNLQTALTLNAAGMQFMASGSHHYLMGAQALLLVGVSIAGLKERDARGWLAWLGLAVSTYAALASGSRGVQLPLVLMLVLAGYRLLRERSDWRLLAARAVLLMALLEVSDAVLTGHPLQTGLGRSGQVANANDFKAEGSAGSRLLMWDQTWRIALQYPFGTGNASFRDVLPAFQRYPSINFGSAHNLYLETLATGGWWRLAALLGLLLPILWRAWQGRHWGVALGAAGLWATLGFDITGYMPSVMTLAFAALGATSGAVRTEETLARGSRSGWAIPAGLRWGLTAVVAGLTLFWYAPCSDRVSCVLDRHLGQREEVTALVRDLPAGERQALLVAAKAHNPRSLWVDALLLAEARTPLERLEFLRGIVRDYPLASTGYYLERAKLASSLGFRHEAIDTLELGLRVFPAGSVSAGVPLRKVDPFVQWSHDAPKLLELLRNQP